MCASSLIQVNALIDIHLPAYVAYPLPPLIAVTSFRLSGSIDSSPFLERKLTDCMINEQEDFPSFLPYGIPALISRPLHQVTPGNNPQISINVVFPLDLGVFLYPPDNLATGLIYTTNMLSST